MLCLVVYYIVKAVQLFDCKSLFDYKHVVCGNSPFAKFFLNVFIVEIWQYDIVFFSQIFKTFLKKDLRSTKRIVNRTIKAPQLLIRGIKSRT